MILGENDLRGDDLTAMQIRELGTTAKGIMKGFWQRELGVENIEEEAEA